MKPEEHETKVYTCLTHPEIISDEPEKCPKCGGMDLVSIEEIDILTIYKNY